MKKIISLLLGAGMILSSVQAVWAEETAEAEIISSVLFASDYQFFNGDTQTFVPEDMGTITGCQPIVDRLVKTVKNNGHNPETFVLGGDYTQNDYYLDPDNAEMEKILFGDNIPWHYGNPPQYTMDEIEEVSKAYFPDMDYLYVQGNHDPDIGKANSERLSRTGAYEYEDYIVYILNEQDAGGPRPRAAADFATRSDIFPDSMEFIAEPAKVCEETAADMKVYFDGLIEAGDTRPVFVCSHQMIHYVTGSNYNGNMHYIFDALNEAAEKLDIVFFFGHTHSGSDSVGGDLAYKAVGETMDICNNTMGANGKSTETLNFTYMNYGFLAKYKKADGSNGKISASVIDITGDTLEISRYGLSNDLLAQKTITRKTPAKTGAEIEEIKIGTVKYGTDLAKYTDKLTAVVDGKKTEVDSWKLIWKAEDKTVLDVAPAAVGKYVLTAVIEDEEYRGSTDVEFEIVPKEVTVQPESHQVKKGAQMPEFKLEAEGIIPADSEAVNAILDTAEFTCEAADTDTAGTYEITWTNRADIEAAIAELPEAANYTFTYKDTAELSVRRTTGGSLQPVEYVYITFETGTDEVINKLSVLKNRTVSDLPEPQSGRYEFAGWYKDKAFEERFTTSDKVTESITLYAKWVDENGEAVSDKTASESTDNETAGDTGNTEDADNTEDTENDGEDKNAENIENAGTSDTGDEFFENAADNAIILVIGNTKASVFGKILENDVPPVIRDNRTMLPVRFISEAFGAVVDWDAETSTVSITSDNVEISFVIGNSHAVVNSEEVSLDCPAMIENNRTYLPIRFIAEKIGATVEWDEESRVITITK